MLLIFFAAGTAIASTAATYCIRSSISRVSFVNEKSVNFVLIKTMLRLWCWTSFQFTFAAFQLHAHTHTFFQWIQLNAVYFILKCIQFTLSVRAAMHILSFLRTVNARRIKCNELIMIQKRNFTAYSSYLVPVFILFVNFASHLQFTRTQLFSETKIVSIFF